MYVTSTVWSLDTGLARTNLIVSPLTVLEVTVTVLPSTVTWKFEIAAVVALNVSSNVNVRSVPFAARTAGVEAASFGGIRSTT